MMSDGEFRLEFFSAALCAAHKPNSNIHDLLFTETTGMKSYR